METLNKDVIYEISKLAHLLVDMTDKIGAINNITPNKPTEYEHALQKFTKDITDINIFQYCNTTELKSDIVKFLVQYRIKKLNEYTDDIKSLIRTISNSKITKVKTDEK